jgi:hypothetical protein
MRRLPSTGFNAALECRCSALGGSTLPNQKRLVKRRMVRYILFDPPLTKTNNKGSWADRLRAAG